MFIVRIAHASAYLPSIRDAWKDKPIDDINDNCLFLCHWMTASEPNSWTGVVFEWEREGEKTLAIDWHFSVWLQLRTCFLCFRASRIDSSRSEDESNLSAIRCAWSESSSFFCFVQVFTRSGSAHIEIYAATVTPWTDVRRYDKWCAKDFNQAHSNTFIASCFSELDRIGISSRYSQSSRWIARILSLSHCQGWCDRKRERE